MLSLTYLSSAVLPWSDQQLEDMLLVARPRNQGIGVTGMLLYSNGNFMQTLEGPADPVDARFTSIDADPRHRGLFILSREEIRERRFADWSMGFSQVARDEVERLPGFTDYLRTGRVDGEEPCRSTVASLHEIFRARAATRDARPLRDSGAPTSARPDPRESPYLLAPGPARRKRMRQLGIRPGLLDYGEDE